MPHADSSTAPPGHGRVGGGRASEQGAVDDAVVAQVSHRGGDECDSHSGRHQTHLGGQFGGLLDHLRTEARVLADVDHGVVEQGAPAPGKDHERLLREVAGVHELAASRGRGSAAKANAAANAAVAVAEIVGTFILVFTGTAVAALGHVSGAHLNPAVTLSLAATGKFP